MLADHSTIDNNYLLMINLSQFNSQELILLLISIIYALTLIGSLSAAILIKHPEGRALEFRKIFGGVAVLSLAITSESVWIYFVSLLIGGLLIASENFMLFLAAIISSDRKNVHRIPEIWRNMSPDEVEKARISDAQVATSVEKGKAQTSDGDYRKTNKVTDKAKNKHSEPTQDRDISETEQVVTSQKIKDVEEKAINQVSYKVMFDKYLKRHVQILDAGVRKNYDAVIVAKNTNRVLVAIETKFFVSMSAKVLEVFLDEFMPKYRSTSYPVLFMIVFDNYDHTEADKLLDVRKSFIENYPDHGLALYENKALSLVPINDEDIDKILPDW